MTEGQKRLYWRQWGKVRQVLTDMGGFSAADADAERAAITTEALGGPKSSRSLSNTDLDKVLDAFRAILVLPDGPRAGPTRADSQPQARRVFAVRETGLEDEYIAAIAADQFRAADWTALPDREMTCLLYTCRARARARRKKQQKDI